MRSVTSLIGATAEAWQELRVNRLRVLLSLIVVAISVAAFTAVVAMGQMLNQGYQEQMERSMGRPALVSFSAFDPASGQSDADTFGRAFESTVERYGVDWWSRVGYVDVMPPPDGWINLQAVDADYGVFHRISVDQGSWFTEDDARRLVPTIVINEYWWESIGSPALDTHPTVPIETATWGDSGMPAASGRSLEAIVIGVTPSGIYDTGYNGYLLFDAAAELMGEDAAAQASYEAWLPLEEADTLMEAMRTSIQAHFPEGTQVDAFRNDYLAQDMGYDPFGMTLIIFGAISIIILVLGALSLLNITLVTVRYRIREIGVRRSFGATAGRVFFSVMLESVVGTVVAGAVGIAIAVLVLRLPAVGEALFAGIEDVPAFPMQAAVIGLLISAGVGALAGLLPALVAVRVKPIDAIRY